MKPTTVQALADTYEVFLIDQYGVMHDGQRPYPGAVAALEALKRRGRTVIILSNSAKRAAPNERRLEGLGFSRSQWDHLVTSGETARALLRAGTLLPAHPKTCHIVARDDDASVIEGLGIAVVEDPAEADCLLVAASDAPRLTLQDYERHLRPAALRGVPALCLNPDMTMLVPGGLAFAAGRIARLYEELGGRVTWIGKPHPAIYEAARALAPEGRAICIGDSVEHDVVGGRRAGLATALVRTGIHAEDSEAALADEFRRCGARPDYCLRGLSWA